jgi:hypothetical protein
MQILWLKAVALVSVAIAASGQVQYTIDAKSDNSFFHELMTPSISSSNARQNIYSRYGERFFDSKKL